LSVGDAFGDGFFGNPTLIENQLRHRQAVPAPWDWTDDTAMGISVFRTLRDCGRIHQDVLAERFASEYKRERNRGYGGTAHSILRALGEGVSWEQAAGDAFDGMGSYGNGAAMRAGPIGAYFAEDLSAAAAQARLSAAVTHAHEEGQAGAIAVAVAAGWATTQANDETSGTAMLDSVLGFVPQGETRTGLMRARELNFEMEPAHVAATLGCGYRVSAQDTVPFALWCAARHLKNYEEALWSTASALGDVDTTCAIVGSIVVLSAGASSIPASWLANREPLPEDITFDTP
jgi:ADP-ribosylglycohydrolase